MDAHELEVCRKERIDNLNNVLSMYRSSQRKNKFILGIIVFICIAALYFLFTSWLGSLWGTLLTLVVLFIALGCVMNLGISFNNAPMSDGQLSCYACIAMDALIKIKKGTYDPKFNIVHVGEGEHLNLYKEFAKLYPNLASNDLKRISKINITRKDLNDVFNVNG